MSFVSRRSPWMVPPPPGPDDGLAPEDALLRLLLSTAWRPRALAVSLAAGLGRIPDGAGQEELSHRVTRLLRSSNAASRLAVERGLEETERIVASRLAAAPLPTCASWAECLLADAIYGRALELAAAELNHSSDLAIASLTRPGPARGGSTLAALAADAKNRECLQILVDRWMPAAVRVFGRPGAACEPELLDSRIKPRPAVEALADFLADIETRLGQLGLWVPDAARMGVSVPAGWTPGSNARN